VDPPKFNNNNNNKNNDNSSALLGLYTASQKHVPPLTYYNLDTHDQTAIIFGRTVTEKIRNQMMLCFPPHLPSASAMPCKTENPEDSVLALSACNTIQLLQCSRLPSSWTIPFKSPKLNALIQDLGTHTAAWVKVKVGFLYSITYMVDQEQLALTISKWQLIGKRQWCCSANVAIRCPC